MKKRKGFTLMELLVVIAIIALLMGILMPALGRVRELANQLVCGTNIRGLMTAIMIYAHDYDEDMPLAGSAAYPIWGDEPGPPAAANRWRQASATPIQLFPNNAPTVSASLFLLTKFADVGTKSYICKSANEKKFTPEAASAPVGVDLLDCWDFGIISNPIGQRPSNFVSYSYAPGYSTASTPAIIAGLASASAMPILADRSPWFDPIIVDNASTTNFSLSTMKGVYNWNGAGTTTTEQNKCSNSGNHDREGQNVGYSDNHVSFEKKAIVGMEDDEIYTIGDGYWPTANCSISFPTKTNYLGCNRDDSVLISDVLVSAWP